MKKKLNINYKTIIRSGYLFVLFLMAGIMLAIVTGRRMPQNVNETDTFFMTDTDWTLDAGGSEPVDMGSLGTFYEKDSNVLSIYYRLPELDDSVSIVYRSKDVYTKLLVDGETVYETQMPEFPFYNKSPGNIWNTFKLGREYSGKTLEMQVRYVYDTNAVTVDHIYIGDKADIITSLIRNKTGALFISIFMILAGLFMVVYDLIPKKNDKISHGILYMGIYALIMGGWSLLETNVIQFFAPDARLIQLADNICMVTGTLPLFLYLDCEYEILKHRFIRILSLADIVFLMVCGIGQMSGLTDLHAMLPLGWFFMGVFFIILITVIIYRFVMGIKNGEKNVMVAFHLAGIVCLWGISIVSVIYFTNHDTMDRAQAMRLGMLVFVILFAVSSELNAFKLMQNGLQYEIIRNLAYQDGLTKLGNRTSYLEQLDNYDKIHIEKVGMVFLDVNNLKQVNDNLGHEEGDKLLQLAAEVIVSTFGNYGESYRIGGDEFCVFLATEKPEETYRQAKEEFYEAINQVNSAQCYPFHLQIAHGFAQCENANKLRLKDMVDQADTRMYINKEQLKRSSGAKSA